MALAIDASTPAVVTQPNSTTQTLTTGSFTPPAGALLLIRWAGNSGASESVAQPTITDNLGGHLTYTLLDWQSRADSPTRDGQAACWWAVVGSSAAMTVTVTNQSNPANAADHAALHVTVITGQDAVTPIGAHGKSGSASAASIAQSYTAQATSGWGFIGVCDWDVKGAETAGTGCTLTNGGSASISTFITYGFLRRTSADDVNGNSNTLNVTLPGTSTNLSWVYAEVLPAGSSSSSFTAPVLTVAQAPNQTRVAPVVVAPTIGPPQVIRLPQIAVVQNPRVRPGPAPFAITPPPLPPQAIPLPPIAVAPQSQIPQLRGLGISAAQIIPPLTTILPLTVTVVAEQFRPAVVAPIVLTPPLLPPFAAAVTVVGSRSQSPLPAVVSITPPPLPQYPAPIIVVPARSQPPLAAVISIVPSPLPQALAPIVVVTSTWRPQQPQISVSQPGFAAPVIPALAPAGIAVVKAFGQRPGIPPLALTPAPLPTDVGVGRQAPYVSQSGGSTAVVSPPLDRTASERLVYISRNAPLDRTDGSGP